MRAVLLRFSLFLGIVGTLLLHPIRLSAAKGEEFPGMGRKWACYASPNFELFSTNSDAESRAILEQMELLRALFLDTFGLKARLPQPVTIYAFNRRDEFNAYQPPHVQGGKTEYAGFCSVAPDRTVITLAPMSNDDASRQVVYHEYIHYLFRVTEQDPPAWFNEGAAELFSTLKEDGEWLVLGQPVIGRVFELQHQKLMPFTELFAVRSDSPLFRNSKHTGLFYAQSWAFLHYCRFGVHKIPKENISRFLRIASLPQMQRRPEDFRQVCRELLGMDYVQLAAALDRYVTSGQFMSGKVKRPTITPRKDYVRREVLSEEARIRLAELSLRVTDSGRANLAIRDARERQPDVRLTELLGAVALRGGEESVARERWNEAVDAGSTNPAIFREISRLESNAVFSRFDLDYRMPVARCERLRFLLERSIALAPEQRQGYEMLAWVEATAQQPAIRNINRVQARFPKLEDKARTLLALAVIRLRLDRKEEAVGLLAEMEGLAPDPWTMYGVEMLQARLENRPVDRSRLPATPGPGGESVLIVPQFNAPR